MTTDEIFQAVRGFLELLEAELPAEEREARLRLALDRLALATHFADGAPNGDDAPDSAIDYRELRARMGPRFPELGYYRVVLEPEDVTSEEPPVMGDAIDDLCDIALDLSKVEAAAKVDRSDALWQLRFTYDVHWGQHLRCLQQYLYARAT